MEECFSACKFREICLLKLGFSCLSALAGCAAFIAVVKAGRFKHEKLISIVSIVRTDDFAWSERPDRIIESVGIEIKRKSLGKSSTTDVHIIIFYIFLTFVSAIGHNMPSIRNFPTDGHSNMLINIEDSTMSSSHKKFRKHQFLSPQNNTINTLHSYNSPKYLMNLLCTFDSFHSILELQDTTFLSIGNAILI